jgi:glycosyltransferase involved in cell wall biosynthesis
MRHSSIVGNLSETSLNVSDEVGSQFSPRLLFLCAELDNGGAERHWAALIPALARRGAGVRVVAIKGGGRALERLRASGVPIRELGRSGFRSFVALPPLLEEQSASPTAVVTFGYNSHVLGALFSRATGTPQVLNWHRQQGWPMNRVERNAVRLAARSGAGVIAVTNAQCDDLSGLGFRQDRIRVVNNGVARPVEIDVPPASIRARLGLPKEAFIAVLVARLRPEKCISDFIDAIALAKTSLPNLVGIVVGDGPMLGELQRYASSRSASVQFVGYQSDPGAWMLASDVVCLTSRFEALPISLLEATSCGRPCIASDVGGNREIVQSGVNGLLTPAGAAEPVADAIVRLGRNRGLAEAMGREGLRLWREQFDFKVMVERYWSLLRAVHGPPTNWAPATGRL